MKGTLVRPSTRVTNDWEAASSSSDTRYSALRRKPSQARGVKRIKDVMDACERLLKRHRADELTMEQIAAAARIQIGSLYHFFPDKTAVYVTVLERALEAERDAFRAFKIGRQDSFERYLTDLEGRLARAWHPPERLDLYFALQRHPLIWAAQLRWRETVARDVGHKLQQFDPRITEKSAINAGRTIGIIMAVLHDNSRDLKASPRRVLRAECFSMLSTYVANLAARQK